MPKKSDQKFRITIRNWDKHQTEMTGKKKSRLGRDWIAVSTDLLHDPDFFELTLEQRWLWVALLLHAGRVGHVFELSTSSARVLFKLRPGWKGVDDLRALEIKGFIDLKAVYKQDLTGHDRTNKTLGNKKKPDKPKSKPEDDDRLVELKAIYPKRSGSQPWSRALKAANARMKEGATWSELLDGVRRYAEFCRQTDAIGTVFVKMAATFFGPDQFFKEPWDPPAGKADRRQDRTVEAGHTWLEKSDE